MVRLVNHPLMVLMSSWQLWMRKR